MDIHRWRVVFLQVVLWHSITSSSIVAQESCSQGRISEIEVNIGPIYDVDRMPEDQKFLWVYRAANTIHINTKRDVVGRELLFEVGDCYNQFDVSESERILRAFPFIAQAEIVDTELPDGNHRITVNTRDDWSLKVSLGLSVDEGFTFEGVGITEVNFLGKGIAVGLVREEDREQKDFGGLLEAPRFFGTRWRPFVEGGTTRNGIFVDQGFYYPFVGEMGSFGAREFFNHREELFAYSTSGESPFSQVLLPLRKEVAEISVITRFGEPGDWLVFGGGISREFLEFPGFPGRVEGAVDDDFSSLLPTEEPEQNLLRTQAQGLTSTRINLVFGRRGIRFQPRAGLDAVAATQDVQVGTEFLLTLSPSIGLLEEDGLEVPDDLFTRFEAFGGFASEFWVFNSQLRVEARRVFGEEGQEDDWEDVLAEADIFVFTRPEYLGNHTLFGRVSASGGWAFTQPFQLTLGGRDGVRGFSRDAFPGGRRILATIEDRIPLGWPPQDFFDLGAAFFVDAGRGWHGEVPYGVDSGWKASLGAGLRFGAPSGSVRVSRFDVTVPVSSRGGADSVAFRFYAEVVGLLSRGRNRTVQGVIDGMDDAQTTRSRRSGFSSDFSTRPRGG